MGIRIDRVPLYGGIFALLLAGFFYLLFGGHLASCGLPSPTGNSQLKEAHKRLKGIQENVDDPSYTAWIRIDNFLGDIHYDDIELEALGITEEDLKALEARAKIAQKKWWYKQILIWAAKGDCYRVDEAIREKSSLLTREQIDECKNLCYHNKAVNDWNRIVELSKDPEFSIEKEYRKLTRHILFKKLDIAAIEKGSIHPVPFSDIGKLVRENHKAKASALVEDLVKAADDPKVYLTWRIKEARREIKRYGFEPAEVGLTEILRAQLLARHEKVKALDIAKDRWEHIQDIEPFVDSVLAGNEADLPDVLKHFERTIRDNLRKAGARPEDIGMTDAALEEVRELYRETHERLLKLQQVAP